MQPSRGSCIVTAAAGVVAIANLFLLQLCTTGNFVIGQKFINSIFPVKTGLFENSNNEQVDKLLTLPRSPLYHSKFYKCQSGFTL